MEVFEQYSIEAGMRVFTKSTYGDRPWPVVRHLHVIRKNTTGDLGDTRDRYRNQTQRPRSIDYMYSSAAVAAPPSPYYASARADILILHDTHMLHSMLAELLQMNCQAASRHEIHDARRRIPSHKRPSHTRHSMRMIQA